MLDVVDNSSIAQSDAKVKCYPNGGDLASINENQEMYDFLRSLAPSDKLYWVTGANETWNGTGVQENSDANKVSGYICQYFLQGMDLLEPYLNTGFTFRRSGWWYYNFRGVELRGKGSRDDLNQNFYIEKIDEQNFYMKTHNGTYLCLEISSHFIRSNIITPDDLTPDYTCVLNAYQYNQRPGRVAFNFAIHGDFFFDWFVQLVGSQGAFRYDRKFYVVWKPVEV